MTIQDYLSMEYNKGELHPSCHFHRIINLKKKKDPFLMNDL